MDQHLCNHINIMEDLIGSKGLVAVNSDYAYIKQDQLHGASNFVTTDTEWSLARWGYGPNGHITEFGAADAEDTVLVTGLQPIPLPGPERTKKKKELQVAMQWGSSTGALRAGHSTSTSLVVGIWKANFLATS
jgi:hypothetical protein